MECTVGSGSDPVIGSILFGNKVNVFVSTAGEVDEDGTDVGVGGGQMKCMGQCMGRLDGRDDPFQS